MVRVSSRFMSERRQRSTLSPSLSLSLSQSQSLTPPLTPGGVNQCTWPIISKSPGFLKAFFSRSSSRSDSALISVRTRVKVRVRSGSGQVRVRSGSGSGSVVSSQCEGLERAARLVQLQLRRTTYYVLLTAYYLRRTTYLVQVQLHGVHGVAGFVDCLDRALHPLVDGAATW